MGTNMWIMSQNKRILSNVDEVIVTFVDENKCFISGFWGTGSDTLGIYSSREKALKVLKEIQDAIEDTFYYNIENMGCGSYALKKGCEIYEMPQDEEVEL